jgi:plastocyanin domain-containing protein
MGLSRDVTRGIVGRSDAKIALTLESMDKVNKHYDGYVESHIQAVKQSKKEIIECEA